MGGWVGVYFHCLCQDISAAQERIPSECHMALVEDIYKKEEQVYMYVHVYVHVHVFAC